MPVKLQHIVTGKHLHSHQEHPPPVSQGNYREVTAYGLPGFPGDANDDWLVQPIDGSTLVAASPFRLQHLTGCFLSSQHVSLPEWGLGYQEVLCDPNGAAAALWIIEEAL